MKKLLAFIAAAGFSLSAFAAPEVYVIDGSHTFPVSVHPHGLLDAAKPFQ